jgi:hypothetical protein
MTKVKTDNATETAGQAALADIVEIVSDGTAMGKTTLAERIVHLYREGGRPARLVRIETGRRRGRQAGLGEADVFIATEDFASAEGQTGGLVGVLSPLFDAILAAAQDGGAVVVDWPGGQGAHRLQVLAATSFDSILASMKLAAVSLVVTSSAADHMAQAQSYLAQLKKIAPGLARALVLSERGGAFRFAKGSEQAEAMARLLSEAGPIPQLRIPLVQGRALQVCADAGLDPATAMSMPTAVLAQKLRTHVFQAAACATELAMWWSVTGKELRRALASVRHE